jgi:hypothetical protein
MVGPVAGYIKRGHINQAIDDAHTISVLLFQYGTDNNGVYPTGADTSVPGKSEGIARDLLANNYTPDPTIFALKGAEPYAGKGADFADFGAANISWDFTAAASPTDGISVDAPDLLPVVFTTGETATYPASGGAGLTLSGKGPFEKEGMVAGYKNGNAVWLKAVAQGPDANASGFISKDFKGAGPYSQVRP